MYFKKEYIEYVKSYNPLLDVIEDYVSMKKQGQLWIGKCPFHQDENPSLKYYSDDDHAYCYGCNLDFTDSIDFIMEIEQSSFPEAVIFLAERADLAYPDNKKQEYSKVQQIRFELNSKAREFTDNLNENEEAKQYLLQRGLNKEDFNKWQLGYCDFRYVNKSSPYKKFTNRIIFPIFNHQKRIVGFSGRVLPLNEDKYAKYINSSSRDNLLFNKKELVYGLDKAKQVIRKENCVFWVEGFFDVILMHTAGVKNTIGNMGTAITKEKIKLVRRFTNNIILFMDPDQAGNNAIRDSIELFSKQDVNLKIIRNTKGLDPAEIVLKEDNFKNWLYTHARSIEQYYVDKYLSQYNTHINRAKSELIRELKAVFKDRLDYIETEIALDSICKVINVDLNSLKKMINS